MVELLVDIAFLLSVPVIISLLVWRGVSFSEFMYPKSHAGRILLGLLIALHLAVAVARNVVPPQSISEYFLSVLKGSPPVFNSIILVVLWLRLVWVLIAHHSVRDDASPPHSRSAQ